MDDFKRASISDTIHCEYEVPSTALLDSASFQRNYNNKANDWKLYRPSWTISLRKSMTCSFFATVLGGALVGIAATAVVWLDINLIDLCSDYDSKQHIIPVYILKIRLTAQVFEGLFVQSWSFIVFFAVFGWPLMKELSLLNWSMLASFADAIYRLLLYVYGNHDIRVTPYPLNAIFIAITLFNGYRIASFYRQNVKERLSLAIRLGGQFYMGFPVAVFFNYFIIPFYKTLPEPKQALVATFAPILILLPKTLARVFAQKLKGINHPGTSGMLLIVLYIGGAIIVRVLQAQLHSFKLFVLLCLVHGLSGTIDKLTLPLQDYLRNKCCNCRKRLSIKHSRTPRENRLDADLALLSIILETATIVVNCAIVQIFRYYYDQDNFMKHNGYKLLEDFLWRAIIGLLIEWAFNTLSVQLQTYYYNIPIIRVWNFRWRWMIVLIILNTVIAMLFFSDHLYVVVRSKTMLSDPTINHTCVGPFKRPF